MAARAFASARAAKVSDALVLRTVAYGEADVIVTLLTALEGKVSLIARGARSGSKRFAGTLEPFHTIEVRYEDRRGEVGVLREGRLTRVRASLTSSLEAMEAAGRALRWARHVCPPRTEEPEAWEIITNLMDLLDEASPRFLPLLASTGLRLLGAVGYSLELERCVQCGAACPPNRSVTIDPARGGIVCRACGGASVLVSAACRQAAVAAQGGSPLDAEHARAVLDLVERAMATHVDYEG